jgi:hypothetical protein
MKFIRITLFLERYEENSLASTVDLQSVIFTGENGNMIQEYPRRKTFVCQYFVSCIYRLSKN